MKYQIVSKFSLILSASIALSVSAQNLKTSDGKPVRNSFGECWRTSSWTPANASPECDGAIVQAAVKPTHHVEHTTTPKSVPAQVHSKSIQSEKLILDAETTFDFNKAVLLRSGKIALDKFIQDYKNSNIQSVTATGYTDSIGSDAYNKKLSLKRAQAVKAYLVSKGINKNLITIEGLGKSNPVAPNTTEQGRAKNRRVEIQIKLK